MPADVIDDGRDDVGTEIGLSTNPLLASCPWIDGEVTQNRGQLVLSVPHRNQRGTHDRLVGIGHESSTDRR